MKPRQKSRPLCIAYLPHNFDEPGASQHPETKGHPPKLTLNNRNNTKTRFSQIVQRDKDPQTLIKQLTVVTNDAERFNSNDAAAVPS